MNSSQNLTIRQNVPFAWVGDKTLRFGIDKPILHIENPTAAQQCMLLELRAGIPRSSLNARGEAHGLSPAETQLFIEKLQPVLTTYSEALGNSSENVICVHAKEPVVSHLATALQHSRRVVTRGLPATLHPQLLAITVEHYVGDPNVQHRLYAAGIPFLPIRFSDQSIVIGPIVADSGPCHVCIRLWTEQNDQEWRNCALQLINTPAPTQTPSLISLASAFALQKLQRWEAGDETILQEQQNIAVSPQGVVTGVHLRTLTHHADCACARLTPLPAAA